MTRKLKSGISPIICIIVPHRVDLGKSMAIKATIFKVNLQIADMERHYYQDHTLTLARHPSDFLDRQICGVN
jgi:hypothetical protein